LRSVTSKKRAVPPPQRRKAGRGVRKGSGRGAKKKKKRGELTRAGEATVSVSGRKKREKNRIAQKEFRALLGGTNHLHKKTGGRKGDPDGGKIRRVKNGRWRPLVNNSCFCGTRIARPLRGLQSGRRRRDIFCGARWGGEFEEENQLKERTVLLDQAKKAERMARVKEMLNTLVDATLLLKKRTAY